LIAISLRRSKAASVPGVFLLRASFSTSDYRFPVGPSGDWLLRTPFLAEPAMANSLRLMTEDAKQKALNKAIPAEEFVSS
jgi:hypothetical protein